MKKLLLSLSTALLLSGSLSAQYWANQFTGFTVDSRGIAGMHVKDANTVWAYAFDGSKASAPNIYEYTKTTDGGKTWTAGEITIDDTSLTIHNIVGIDANTAWVMTTREDGSGGLYKTTDGGEYWEFQKQADQEDSFNNWTHFFDANTGLLGSDPVNNYFEVLKTTDGGTTWARIPSTAFPPLLSGEWGYTGGVTFVGDTVFFYTNKGRIFRSTDKGNTWTIALPAGFVVDFGSTENNGLMAFSSATKGMVFKKTGSTGLALYRTTDGANWSQVNYTGITAANSINSIAYVPGTDVLLATSAVQNNSGSWKSLDNGTTWTRIDNSQHLNVKCIDISNCYSGAFSNAALKTGMHKSTTALAVNDIKSKAKAISVSPNPTSSVFSINSTGFDAKTTKVTVTDMTGRVVKTFDNSSSYNVSDLAKGTYMVTIKDGNSVDTQKLIKN